MVVLIFKEMKGKFSALFLGRIVIAACMYIHMVFKQENFKPDCPEYVPLCEDTPIWLSLFMTE